MKKSCKICKSVFEKPKGFSKTQWGERKFCSLKCAGVLFSKTRTGQIGKTKGIKMSDEARKKMSMAKLGKKRPDLSGENNHFWKGGITTVSYRLRRSQQYKRWRASVFVRDNYTCQECGQHGGRLQADHIKPWATHTELRFNVNNGRTLCVSCHKKTETYGVKYFIKTNHFAW